MYITLVRHAETFSNEDNKMAGFSNSKLSRRGVNNALMLKSEIENEKYDLCYMSPLARCVETAMILIGDRVLTKVDDRLIERDIGEFSSKSQKKYDKKKYWEYNLNSNDSGVERIQDVFKRCEDFLDDVTKDNKDIMVVSHEAVIRCMHHLLNKTDLNSDLTKIDIPNCYIEKIEVKKWKTNI